MLTLTLIQKQLTHLVQVQNKTSLVDQKIELTLVILELQVVLVLTHTHLVELLLHLMEQVNLLVEDNQWMLDHHIMHCVTS